MSIQLKFDSSGTPEIPTLILAKRNGEKLGILEKEDMVIRDCFNNPCEITFTVNKTHNEKIANLWEDIVNFRLVYCQEWNVWFDITVDVEDSNNVIKNVFCRELCQSELSQIKIYNTQINTEDDIARDDYVNPTVFYNPDNPSESLLHRITQKAVNYTLGHIDNTLRDIQRTFEFDDKSLYDVLLEISEEIGCIFVFSSSNENGDIARIISAYDLESNCLNDKCKHRGQFDNICPECGGTDIQEGYGEDTTIFITSDELANNIKLDNNADEVKNCFKLQAGDDLMTSTIRLCNPNGTDYIYNLPDYVKNDMSDELKNKINDYDRLYEEYQKEHEYGSHTSWTDGYNYIIETYKQYNPDLKKCGIVKGYSNLIELYYDAIDLKMYLQSVLMPKVTIPTTNASEQLSLLTSSHIGSISVENKANASTTTVSNNVLGMAKAIVDPRYNVEIISETSGGINYPVYNSESSVWKGRFKVTNYSDEEDKASSNTFVELAIDNNYMTFIKNKMDKIIGDGKSKNYGIEALFSLNYDDFTNELAKYCLDSLSSFHKIAQSCVDILIEQSAAYIWGQENKQAYVLYQTYYAKLIDIESEIKTREGHISIVDKFINDIEYFMNQTHKVLDFQNYLGDELWKEFVLYRREEKYQNNNYISDGLNNSELINKATEFIKTATQELYKASELQYSISSSLKNLLVIQKFKPILNSFAVGNWLRVSIDDVVYKLRLLSYEVDFDNLENLQVEFSDVYRTYNGISDQSSIMNTMSQIATSYGATQKQSTQGSKTKRVVDNWIDEGLALNTTKILTETGEQYQSWDDNGMVFKRFNSDKNDYDDKQMKIINSTIAITSDNWRTVKTAIGLFKYLDPDNGEIVENYGINGELILGRLILGNNLKIYNNNGTLVFDENGLVVSNGTNAVYITPNGEYLFNIKSNNEDVLTFNEEGDLVVKGNIEAKDLSFTNTDFHGKVLMVSSAGKVVPTDTVDNANNILQEYVEGADGDFPLLASKESTFLKENITGNPYRFYGLTFNPKENTLKVNKVQADSFVGKSTSAGHADTADKASAADKAGVADTIQQNFIMQSSEEYPLLGSADSALTQDNVTGTPYKFHGLKYTPTSGTLKVRKVDADEFTGTASKANYATNAGSADTADVSATILNCSASDSSVIKIGYTSTSVQASNTNQVATYTTDSDGNRVIKGMSYSNLANHISSNSYGNIRPIYYSTNAPSSSLATGAVWLQYEE